MALTFCLSDCVADFGLDVMHTVLRKDQGQAERGHTYIKILKQHIPAGWKLCLTVSWSSDSTLLLITFCSSFWKTIIELKNLFTQISISFSEVLTACTQSCSTSQTTCKKPSFLLFAWRRFFIASKQIPQQVLPGVSQQRLKLTNIVRTRCERRCIVASPWKL